MDINKLFEIAETALDNDDFKKAIKLYSLILVKDPNNVIAFINRGFAFFSLEDFHGALNDAIQATTLDPQNHWKSEMMYPLCILQEQIAIVI